MKYRLIVALGFVAVAHAVDFEWINSGSGNWNDPANWDQPSFPNANNADPEFFNAITGPAVVNVNGNFLVNDMRFDSSFPYTLSGTGTLSSLDQIQVTVTNGAANHIVSVNMTMTGPDVWSIGSGASLTLSGALSGSGGFNKAQAGTLILSGSTPNSFTGNVNVNSGTLVLSKDDGITAIAGGLTDINTAMLRCDSNNQFSGNNEIELSSAGSIFNLNGTTQTIRNLDKNDGTFIGGGGTLNITANGNLRGIDDNNGGSYAITLNFTGSTTQGIRANNVEATMAFQDINLGSTRRDFEVTGSVPVDLDVNGVMSGSAGFRKLGGGVMSLTGSSPNTFTGTTTHGDGTLLLAKQAGVTAISGDLIITADFVRNLAPNQIADDATVTVNGGDWDLNGNSETIGSLFINGGGDVVNIDELFLNSTGTALSMSGRTLGGKIYLTGASGGDIVRAAGGTTAQINDLDLGDVDRTINVNVQSGDSMRTVGVISGRGGIIKTGGERLAIDGSTSNTYLGATVMNGGELFLNKSSGAVAIPGDLIINAGRVEYEQPAQIAGMAQVTFNGGIFDLDTNLLNIGGLIYNAGTFITVTGYTLNSMDNALTMRDTSITQPVSITSSSGGTVRFDATNGGTASIVNLDLGVPVRTFTIEDGGATPDMEISGVVSGTGGIRKRGEGRLELSGASANTYSNDTIIEAGTLFFNKAASTRAFDGNLTINGGTALLGADGQIPTGSVVTMNSGTFDMAGNDAEIGSLIFNAGTLMQSGGELSITGAGTSLIMRDTTIPEKVLFSAGQSSTIFFDNTNNGSASISEIDVMDSNRTFNISSGTEDVQMFVNAGGNSLVGGGINKAGEGRLQLNGTHNYIGSTCEVSEGDLRVEGTMTANSVFVSGLGTLSGNGTVQATGFYDGTVAPGASIGMLNFVGDQTFRGSVEIEISPVDNDRINVTGGVTLGPNVALNVIEFEGTYPSDITYTIIDTTTGVTGQFATVSDLFPLFQLTPIYTPLQVLLNLQILPFSSLNLGGNSGIMGSYLDSLQPISGGDLQNVVTQIQELTTVSAIEDALDQLSPANFKGLAIANEESALYIRDLVLRRMWDSPCENKQGWGLWMSVIGDFGRNDADKDLQAFDTTSGHAAIGCDYVYRPNTLVGLSIAYSYNDVDWENRRGHGSIDNAHFSLYSNYETARFFTRAQLMGSYNHYHTSRPIHFADISRTAEASYDGGQFLSDCQIGFKQSKGNFSAAPYLEFGYLYTYQSEWEEEGASSINLDIDDTMYSLFDFLAGLHLSHCRQGKHHRYLTELDLAYMREERWGNATYRGRFVGSESTFRVCGDRPDRNLFVPSIVFSSITSNDRTKVSLGYNARISSHFCDQAVFFDLGCRF